MSKPTLDDRPPTFTTDANGRPTAVRLDPPAYIDLLVRANVTDRALWPPGAEHGAQALARIREIEAACIAEHGAFDFDKLPAALQDDYDALCLQLDALCDTGQPVPLSDLVREPDGDQES